MPDVTHLFQGVLKVIQVILKFFTYLIIIERKFSWTPPHRGYPFIIANVFFRNMEYLQEVFHRDFEIMGFLTALNVIRTKKNCRKFRFYRHDCGWCKVLKCSRAGGLQTWTSFFNKNIIKRGFIIHKSFLLTQTKTGCIEKKWF